MRFLFAVLLTAVMSHPSTAPPLDSQHAIHAQVAHDAVMPPLQVSWSKVLNLDSFNRDVLACVSCAPGSMPDEAIPKGYAVAMRRPLSAYFYEHMRAFERSPIFIVD